MPLQPQAILLIVLFITVGLAGGLFFQFHSDAALKRKLWPGYVVLCGALFGCFIWQTPEHALSGSGAKLYLYGAVALITLANLTLVRFCDVCGRTMYPLRPLRFGRGCPSCDAELR